ncbi:hypothetical protein LA374_13820 [Aeromonas schubertii]|uniref:Uncharacterized protein n=1 Tax=Aeromonas schubertii TaxID=652 RepID=A0ABS7VDR3_9GAMM|nr:hypothetical protein [Aeromonas schubertii]MBZ6067275.1 hypothetical protein [Aeromonas schubertii]MBZ6070862.1 hypothetical protein [Aeromonas schubertii]
MPPINGVTTTASHSIVTHGVDTGATTRIGQATSANVSFHEGPNTHQKQGVLYAPFAAPDIVEMAIGKNMIRAQQGKPLYPLICRNEQDKATLEQLRTTLLNTRKEDYEVMTSGLNDYINQMAKNGFTEEEARQNFPSGGPERFDRLQNNISKLPPMIDALTNLTIKGSDDLKLLPPNQHKLYVVGHGGAGMDILAADQACQQGMVTAKEVAHQLAEGGLDKRFTDIRVTACWSADTCAPTSFQKSALDRASQPKTQQSGFLGLFGFGKKEVVAEPFAQTLSNAMKREGFEQPRVSGYHGTGMTFSSFLGEHHLRRLPDSQESDARASTVRQFFIPV